MALLHGEAEACKRIYAVMMFQKLVFNRICCSYCAIFTLLSTTYRTRYPRTRAPDVDAFNSSG